MTTVLVTNDDGADAPGLALLAQVAGELPGAQVWTVAPRSNQSGRSHAVSLWRPIPVQRSGDRTFEVDGTSADCVLLARHALLPQPPDLVLSGVNGGANLGCDLHYSATAGAAAEAALQGLAAVALSLAWDFEDPGRGRGWETVREVVREVLGRISPWGDVQVPDGHYLNVNVPDVPPSRVLGMRVCGLGRRRFEVEVAAGPDGYVMGARHRGHEGGPGCDFAVVEAGYVAITPVSVDRTGYGQLAAAQRDWARERLGDGGFGRGRTA